ncbi:MAG: TIGR03663 family protein [Pirellulaceae bacterium]|nr:TIGR03663 family protein [Pirellulaceae bacterium]
MPAAARPFWLTAVHRLAVPALLMLIVVAGGVLRLIQLDRRTMHADEAVHALKFRDLLEQNRYVYDPHEYHGPSLNYLTLPIVRWRGIDRLTAVTAADLRLLPALCGIALIVLVWLLRDELGSAAMLLAAALTACSPGLVFYSRYYIQEMLLATFSFGAIVAFWRIDRVMRASEAGRRVSRIGWAVALGLCLGMMHASKETSAIAWFAMGLAGAMTLADLRRTDWRRWLRTMLVAVAVAAVVSALFFSSFGQNPRGVADSVLAYFHYFQRAGGTGSAGPLAYPWHTYLRWLFWESGGVDGAGIEAGIAVLAIPGAIAAATGWELDERRLRFARFISLYTLAMILVYSLIAYKTPWCAVGFLHGLVLMAAIGGATLLTAGRRAGLAYLAVATLVIAVALAHLTWQTYRTSFIARDDPRIPYVFSPTSRDVPRLANRLSQIAAHHPDGRGMHVQVICPDDDYWPLPWYLRDFTRVGWFRSVPTGPPAPVIVAHPDLEPLILDYLYQQQPPGQRPLYIRMDQEDADGPDSLRPFVPLRVYIQRELWLTHLARQKRGSLEQ